MKNVKRKILALVSAGLLMGASAAHATAVNMGTLVNDNVDVGSISATGTAIAGSAIGIASLIAAARIGKRLIRAL